MSGDRAGERSQPKAGHQYPMTCERSERAQGTSLVPSTLNLVGPQSDLDDALGGREPLLHLADGPLHRGEVDQRTAQILQVSDPISSRSSPMRSPLPRAPRPSSRAAGGRSRDRARSQGCVPARPARPANRSRVATPLHPSRLPVHDPVVTEARARNGSLGHDRLTQRADLSEGPCQV